MRLAHPEPSLTTKRIFALAAILGFVAVALGGFLLWQGQRGEDIPGVTYQTRAIDPGPMLHLADVLASDALEDAAPARRARTPLAGSSGSGSKIPA